MMKMAMMLIMKMAMMLIMKMAMMLMMNDVAHVDAVDTADGCSDLRIFEQNSFGLLS
jgi:hypothetical protein